MTPIPSLDRRRSVTAEDFVQAAEQRRLKFLIGGALLALLVGGSLVAFSLDNFIVPLVLLIVIATPFLLWHFPAVTLYVTMVAICLFEIDVPDFSDVQIDQIPFFWNINIIFQRHVGIDMKGLPMSPFELLLIVGGVCSLLRAVFTGGGVRLRAGAVLKPMAVYLGFVAFGWVNGMLSGGDFKISLMEVRAQFYLVIAYLIGVNLVTERRQVNSLLWIAVLGIGFKGAVYTYRRYVTLSGLPLPDQGVGSHEEAFLFGAFIVLFLVLRLCNVQNRLQWVMVTLLPLVILGNLATNRRAGTAALIVAVPILIIAAFRALPERRKLVGTIGILLAVGWSVYYPAFKNSPSTIAQPARAVRSHFEPDERDAGSNAYRDAENANIMATIKLDPIFGYGYGKRMLHVAPIADISKIYDWWDILPHNTILWVWMRTGTFGFIAFWMMVAAIVMHLCMTMRHPNADNETKALAIFAVCTVAMLLMVGLTDLQLSNVRDMLFTGLFAGLLSAMPYLPRDDRDAEKELVRVSG